MRGAQCNLTLLAAIAIAVTACGPRLRVSAGERQGQPPASSTLADIASFDPGHVVGVRPVLSLEGDVGFNEDDLNEAQRVWYDRMWNAVQASLPSTIARVADDNVYDLVRTEFLFDHALLLGLRVTGDLRFLDAVDEVAQATRELLEDEWCGRVERSVYVNVRYGTVRSPDGYLNLRVRRGDDIHYCRDTGDLNEALVRGHLALVMYAYHVNRDNPSPDGIDYGERAELWLNYLHNHFEAQWRERSTVAWPGMGFIDLKLCHTYPQMLLYFAYVGLRLASAGDTDADAYLRQSLRLTDGMFAGTYRAESQPGGFVPVKTELGEAVVHSFGTPGATDGAHLNGSEHTR